MIGPGRTSTRARVRAASVVLIARAAQVATLTLIASALLAATATANIGTIVATDEEYGVSIETLASDQNLFALTVSDVEGGDVCVVAATTVVPGDGSLNCTHPAWGSSNHIASVIGTRWTLIETPYLEPGTWRLLADGLSNPSIDNLSEPFTVYPCAPGSCDTRIAEELAVQYKMAAADMAIVMAAMTALAAVLTELNPTEPFARFRNMLNGLIKRAISGLPRTSASSPTRPTGDSTSLTSCPRAPTPWRSPPARHHRGRPRDVPGHRERPTGGLCRGGAALVRRPGGLDR